MRLRWDSKKVREISSYSFSAWLGSLGSVLFSQGDRLAIGSILGPTEVGIYTAITSVAAQINSLSSIFVQPLLPFISQTNVVTDKSHLKSVMQVDFILVFCVSGVLLVFSNVLVPLLIGFHFTTQYLLCFNTIVIIYGFFSVNATGYFVMLGTKSTTSFLLIQLFSGVLTIVLIIIGALHGGIIGAFWGNVGYCFVWLLTFKGFSQLNIYFSEWGAWIRFPTICFSIMSVVALLPINNFIKIVILITGILSLTAWGKQYFYYKQYLFGKTVKG